jgi:dipeptidyl aminopeptidase/acylaminoacyl peptidase
LKYTEPSTNVHRLAVVDATTTTEKTIDLPHEGQVVSWSPDGRSIAQFGPWGVTLVDTSGPELALHTVLAGGSAGLVWSPDGRYIAFQAHHSEGRTDRLYLFDTQSMTLEMLDEVPSGSGIGGFSWAGSSWLIRTFTERSVFLDVAATPRGPSVLAEHVGVPTSPGIASPGGKCFVFTGYCEAASENGVCVRTLPPDPQKPAVLVQRIGENRWFPYWAGTGDQLLLMTGSEPLLVNVELDGGDYTSRIVTAGTGVTGVRAPSWNPSRHSDWIQYFASDGPDRIFKPRLWHRDRGDTYGFPIGDGVAQGTAWSTDSRYLVFEFGTASGSGVYFVQELIDSELGANWILEQPIPAGPSLWPQYLQP